MYIDTHCHLYDSKFDDIDGVIKEYTKEKVKYAINMGCDKESSIGGKTLAEKYESVYFASGFHPSDVGALDSEAFKIIESLLTHEKCVALGEIGLDYHFMPYDKEKQIEGFIMQLELANRYNLPISIHSRDATQDMIELLTKNKHLLKNGGVMHCYSGSVETSKILLDLGLYIGFGGTVTFKNARNLLEVAKFVPIDRMLTETDCPYLSPEPYRGKINSPKNIPIICAFLSNLKGMDNVEFAGLILNNSKRLFYKLV